MGLLAMTVVVHGLAEAVPTVLYSHCSAAFCFPSLGSIYIVTLLVPPPQIASGISDRVGHYLV